MNCLDCPWYDETSKICLKYDTRILFPRIPRKCSGLVPILAANYVKGVKNFTNIPEENIIRSRAFKEYLKKLREVKI